MDDRAARPLFAKLWELGELGDRDALLATIESIIGLGAWVWEPHSGRVSWSPGFYKIMGYDPARDEASIANFYAAVHPDDRAIMSAKAEESLRAFGAYTMVSRVLHRDGHVRHVRFDSVIVRDEDGVVLRLMGTVLDISETVSREHELARNAVLLNEAQRIARVGSWYLEPDTGRLEWSDELYRIYGLSKAITPSKEAFLSLVHPEDRESIEQALGALESRLHGPLEFRIITPSGVQRTLLVEARMLSDGSASPKSLMGTMLDVTEQRRLEEQLRHAQKMEAVGRLAGGIAHDFNNLLAVVQGSAELMRDRIRAQELDDILQATARASALTRQLLAFGRRAVVRPQVLDLNEVVTHSSRLIRRVIGENVRVRLALSAGLWHVLADPAQLEQVIMNLVINARDAMPAGGTLSLSTANVVLGDAPRLEFPESMPGEHVLLSVSDEGVGMDAATRAQMFEPFFTTKVAGQGTGLGLATVFGIVTQAGGCIGVASEPGQGSTFRVYWPRVRAEREKLGAEEQHAELRGSERILVVEDDAQVRSVIARILVSAGYHVESTAYPEQALRMAQRREGDAIDLLLTDMVMPGMSGRALAEQLASAGLLRAVLYVSGYAPQHDINEVQAATYLQKPFTQRDLLRAVRLALEGGRGS